MLHERTWWSVVPKDLQPCRRNYPDAKSAFSLNGMMRRERPVPYPDKTFGIHSQDIASDNSALRR
jgi:hypothetical protein